MTFNDIASRIAAELTEKYEKELCNNKPNTQIAFDPITFNTININSDLARDLIKEGYEKATEVVRQTLYKIVSDEIKSKNLDFLL